MNSFYQNFSIFSALLARDMKVLKTRLSGLAIDGLILVSVAVLIFGSLFPLLGMPSTLIAPIFLGNSLTFFLASLGYGIAIRLVYDLKFGRFIDYFITLPLPKRWLLTYYVISFIIEVAIITIPLITIGIICLGSQFGPINGSFVNFFFIYSLALLFWALFFLSSAFSYSFHWFKYNMWARRLMPFFTLGPAFFTFKTISAQLPIFSKLFWLNPVTYLTEGLRTALLGGNEYLPLSVCMLGICTSIVLMIIRLYSSFHKQLDPV